MPLPNSSRPLRQDSGRGPFNSTLLVNGLVHLVGGGVPGSQQPMEVPTEWSSKCRVQWESEG